MGVSTAHHVCEEIGDVLAFLYDTQRGYADLQRASDGSFVVEGRDIETAATISLFTERRVTVPEAPHPQSLGGWWGESFPELEGDQEGSRVDAILATRKNDRVAHRQIEQAAVESLDWMLRDGVALSVNATVVDQLDTALCLQVEIELSAEQRVLRLQFEI
jgi:phage gp46-like protein